MISSPLLSHMQGYVNGRWTGADSERTFAVINPATGEKLADVPDMAAGETTVACEAAARRRAPARREQTRTGADHHARAGQAAEGVARRGRLRERIFQVLQRAPRGAAEAAHPGAADPQLPLDGPSPARGRGGADH